MSIENIPRLADQPEYQKALEAGPEAAEAAAKKLAAEVWPQVREAHASAVKAIRGALLALCEANQAEEDVRKAAAALGYPIEALPEKGIAWIGKPDNNNGSRAFWYLRETGSYSDD